MRSLPTLPPCLRQGRRLLLVSGFVVPTVLLGSVITAAPAMATTATDKAAVTSAFGAGTSVQLTDDYVGPALAPSDDKQEVAAGTTDTIDLNGHTLDLDQIVVDAGAKLLVTDTAGGGKLVVGGTALQGGDKTGIELLGDAALTVEGGAVVDATGTDGLAGIGSTSATDGAPTVTVTGSATVTAHGGSGAAGIGGGTGDAERVNVTVTDAAVTAVGGADGAGIGGGDGDTVGGTVKVTGSSAVSATGGTAAAGIGGGRNGVGAKVQIQGGRAIVKGGASAAANTADVSAIGAGEGNTAFGSLSVQGTGVLEIPSGSDLVIPSGVTVTDAGDIVNKGELDVLGTLHVSGSVHNSGLARVANTIDGGTGSNTGTGGTFANNGTLTPGDSATIGGDLAVTGNNFDVQIDAAGGANGAASGTTHLYTPDLRTAGIALGTPSKAGKVFTGWKYASPQSSTVHDTTALADLGGASTGTPVELTITAGFDTVLATTAGNLDKATVGHALDVALPVTGDADATYRYTLHDGSTLPAWLQLLPNGHITGTPPQAGDTTFSVDVASDYDHQTYEFTLTAGVAPSITTGHLDVVTVGKAVSEDLAATGDGGKTFEVTTGTLPTGLQLDADGHLHGTVTAKPASPVSVTVKATSAFGTDTADYTFDIGAAPSITTSSLDRITVGKAISENLNASGDGTVHYAVTAGTLPTGLTLDTDGLLHGTVGATPSAPVTVTVTASSGYGSDHQSYTFDIGAAPSITTQALHRVTIAKTFSQGLGATGDGTIHYAVSAGTLPTGLSLDDDGTLHGTVATAPTQAVTITVTATSVYGTSHQDYTFDIGAAPAITTDSIGVITVGKAVSQQLAGSGDGTVTYSVAPGTLPVGLTLDTGGLLHGTVAAKPADPVTVAVLASNDYGTVQHDYLLNIGAAPSITTSRLHAVTVGKAFSQGLAGTGDGSVRYSVTAGTLPSGLTLDLDGTLHGTVATAPAQAVTVTVTADSTYGSDHQNYTFSIGTAPAIGANSIGVITVGKAVSQNLAGTGDGDVAYAVTAGTLPDGLILDPSGLLHGTVAGTPSSPVSVTITASSDFGTDHQAYTLNIGAAPAVTTQSLHTVTVGKPFAQDLAASGDGSVAFTATPGSLPTGLTLDSSGHLSGTVTSAAGQPASVTVTVTSVYGSSHQDLTFDIGDAPSITTQSLDSITVGQEVSQDLTASGPGTITYSVPDGALPTGLTLDAAGHLSGTVSAKPSAPVTVDVTAHSRYGTGVRNLTLDIGAAPAITTTTLRGIGLGKPFSQQLGGSGDGSITYTVPTNSLPSGLSLDPDGTLHGTVSVKPALPTLVTVTATSAYGVAHQQYTLDFGAAPSITTSSLGTLTVGKTVSEDLAAAGDDTATFSVVGDSLPSGLHLDANGHLSGSVDARPTNQATFTVKATSKYGSDTKSYVLDIGVAPSVTVGALPVATVGKAYTKSVGFGGDGTPAYSISHGVLPDGITLDAGTGVLAGTVAAAGTWNFDVRDTTAYGFTDKTYSLIVGAAPVVTTTALSAATVGHAYSDQVAATGDGTITFSGDSTTNPSWVTIDPASGHVSGEPTQTGTWTVTATATSPFGSVTKVFTVKSGFAPSLAGASLAQATIGQPYSQPLAVSGTGVTITKTGGQLPAGLSIVNGMLTGTPTHAGTATFTAAASNDFGTVEHDFTVVVAPVAVPVAPAPVLPLVAPWTVKFGHTADLSVAAESALPTSYTVVHGSLPAGLTLDAGTGAITGNPTASGLFTFQVKATSTSGSDIQQYTVLVPAVQVLISTTHSTVTPQMGAAMQVTISGLGSGEGWTIAVDGKVALRGSAAHSGSVQQWVTLPKSLTDKAHTVTVSGSKKVTDPAQRDSASFTVTSVTAKKTLSVKASASSISVTRLAPNEQVKVTDGGVLIASGRADSAGVFTFTPKALKAGTHKLQATGVFAGRSGSLTLKVTGLN